MAKKHKRRSGCEGLLQSPLVLTLLKLIPTILLLTGVGIVYANFLYLKDRDETVLGTSTELPYRRTIGIKERINELQRLGEKVNSEAVKKEIERLLSL